MFLENCKILGNKKIRNNFYLLELKCSKDIIENAMCGQYIMISTRRKDMILKRPFSIFDIDKEKGSVIFYYEAKGKGTTSIAKAKIGEMLRIQGPLGNGFEIFESINKIVIVAGGVGIAPFKYLLKKYSAKEFIFIIGGRNSEALEIIKYFKLEKIKTIICSDDGSIGFKGNTVERLAGVLKDYNPDIILACGPNIMLKNVCKLASKNNIKTLVSLEEKMACGTNACMGCSIETINGMKKVCYDGPVFKGEDVIWQK